MKLDSILACTDFSDASANAAKWAAEYFAPSARLTLLHVIPSDVLNDDPRARETAEFRLGSFSERLAHRAPRSEVRSGNPAEQANIVAGEIGADVVVIGPHGDRLHASGFLGTIADRIVRTSGIPVLVAGSPPRRAPRNILVALADADVTPALLEWTNLLACSFDAEVTLLHVWSNAVYSHVASACFAEHHDEEAAHKAIEKELSDAGAHWIDAAARVGLTDDRVSAVVTCGDAGDAILELAKSMEADLIVLGRRGSGLVAPALLGSTVGTVLRGAARPVFVVTEPRAN